MCLPIVSPQPSLYLVLIKKEPMQMSPFEVYGIEIEFVLLHRYLVGFYISNEICSSRNILFLSNLFCFVLFLDHLLDRLDMRHPVKGGCHKSSLLSELFYSALVFVFWYRLGSYPYPANIDF